MAELAHVTALLTKLNIHCPSYKHGPEQAWQTNEQDLVQVFHIQQHRILIQLAENYDKHPAAYDTGVSTQKSAAK